MDDRFRGFGVRVKLRDDSAFLVIVETLSRIGVANWRTKTLYQSAHILHKRGEFAILHFKELFGLDGRLCNMDETDVARRNSIALMLEEWGLVDIIDREKCNAPLAPQGTIKVIRHSEKQEWNLESKYQIGATRKPRVFLND